MQQLNRNTFLYLVLILSFLAMACNNEKNNKIGTPGDAVETYLFYGDDQEMNNAIKEARKTFDLFIKAIENPQENQSFFAVKVPFEYDEGNEHLWLVDITIENNKFYGTVNNDPDFTKKVKCDQRVQFDPDSISDWKYFEGDKLIGGYTIKVIYNRFSEEEKKEFQEEYGFIPE